LCHTPKNNEKDIFMFSGIERQKSLRTSLAVGLSGVSLEAALRQAGISSPSRNKIEVGEATTPAPAPFTGPDGTEGTGIGVAFVEITEIPETALPAITTPDLGFGE
jgi:hypothetical protein